MSYSYGNYFSNGNPKSLNECFWAKDYEESNSSRHDVWWIAFYSGPNVNGNPRITFIHKLDRWQTTHPRDIDRRIPRMFCDDWLWIFEENHIAWRCPDFLPDNNDHCHRNIEQSAQMSFRKKDNQQKHLRFNETNEEIILNDEVQNCEHYYRESIAEMKENQEISLDDFIADIVVSLDAKYKELLCAETEIEKMGATAPNIKGAETPKIQGAGSPYIEGAQAETPYIEGAGSPYIEGAQAETPYIEGAGSPYIEGAQAETPYTLGATSPDNLNIIEAPNPSSSPFGGTSSPIVPISELHEGHEVGGTTVSSPTPPDVVLISAIPQVPEVGGTSVSNPDYSRLAKIEKGKCILQRWSALHKKDSSSPRIDVAAAPSPRDGIGVISLSSSDGPNIGIGSALFPRAGIGVTSPTTLQKRLGTAATLPSRAGIGVPPAPAGLSNAIPLAGSAYAGVYPFSTAATDLSYDFAADSPDNPFGPFNSPSTASSGVYPFHCTAAAFGFDDDNPHDYTTAFYYRRISSASGG